MKQQQPISFLIPWWVRGMLLLITGLIVTTLVIATQLHPYDANGQPLRMAAHEQLGMPACSFYVLFKRPCPSCGLTTSFALMMHGDVAASLRANFVGTLMVLLSLIIIPWNLYVLLRGRYLWIRSLERTALILGSGIFVLLLSRWVIVLMWR